VTKRSVAGALKHLKQEAYKVGLQASMSQSALLLECSFAFGKEIERGPSSEPARYGSAFHSLLASRLTEAVWKAGVVKHPPGTKAPRQPSVQTVAKRWGLPLANAELKEHVAATQTVLARWLVKNEFRIDFDAVRKAGLFLIEHAVALRPGVSGRSLSPHDENHRYHGLELGEQPGTLDLAIIPNKRVMRKLPILVLDHKTGEEDFSRPLDKPQLLSLAAGVMRWVGSTHAIVGAVHARRRGLPKVYAEQVKLSELKQYEGRIAIALSRIGDGSMRPGPWCPRCPARSVCPAQDAELLARAGDVLTGLTAAGGALSNGGLVSTDLAVRADNVMSVEKKLGLLYSVVKKSEVLARRARAEIKNAIVASGGSLLPETPDNEYLVVREYEKENLSKTSIVKAYGELAGKRMLEKLRSDGAIKKSVVQELWPEKDRGR
jgi:hypothetical protein